jgi:hypothetical protein
LAVADAIARIEERRDTLDRLADKGMAMIERIAAGETVEIAGRKPFADASRAFAVISRAVRLCLALASRLDEELIALLRGGPIPDLAILKAEAPAAEPATERPVTPRERIARAADAVIEAEAGEGAERMRAHVREHLVEGERYDAYLHLPWRVVVRKIRADLGLPIDGSDPYLEAPPTKSGHPGECRDPDQRSGSAKMSPLAHLPEPPGIHYP